MQQPLVLVVDDEPAVREVVCEKLSHHSFRAISAANGKEAFKLIEEANPDLILLDLRLPDIDGMTICQQIRRKSRIPIIMLTAMGEEVNRIVGLELGADDYITKPCSLDELVARVKAVLRRSGPGVGLPETEGRIKVGGLEINAEAAEVLVDGQPVLLTKTEFTLLKTLAERPGKVFSREELLRAVWGYDQYDTHLVEVHVANLRSKVEKDPRRPERVRTVRAFGYKLCAV
jgi:two-component system, OmpR family, alkaline phosphatase synthesis response regulator PhoP